MVGEAYGEHYCIVCTNIGMGYRLLSCTVQEVLLIWQSSYITILYNIFGR
jgi:hypothetical protein